jgi:hypothetical protein
MFPPFHKTHTHYHENGQARSIQMNPKTISGRFLSIVKEFKSKKQNTVDNTTDTHSTHTHTHRNPQLVCVCGSHERNMTAGPTGKATGKQLTYETARKPVFVFSAVQFFLLLCCVCVCWRGGSIEGFFFFLSFSFQS